MELDERAEEVLETLWISTKEEKAESVALSQLDEYEGGVDQLIKTGFILVSDGQVRLTDQGDSRARDVVRRHRLAERLLTDVLNAEDMIMHEKACKFEHLLDRGLDENICTMLGHPKVCPHGKPIPPGKCCKKGRKQLERLVTPVSEMEPGKGGRIAYIYSPQSSKLQKLISMGIIPGADLKLERSFPSYLFEVGRTQFAVDKEIADSIYVRLEDPGAEEPVQRKCRRRWRFGRRWRLG